MNSVHIGKQKSHLAVTKTLQLLDNLDKIQ